MKIKIAILILAVVCVGLVIALVVFQSQNETQRQSDAVEIAQFSNDLQTATRSLDDLSQVNLALTNDLLASEKQVLAVSNSLTESLTETAGALATARTSLQTAQDQVTNLNSRITDLEAQNKVLDDRATELTNQLVALNAQIAETEQKLANSETNNAFLEKELQAQIAQRNELEHKFNDLNEVRAQVKKLRDAAFVARRVEWARVGATDQKGAELLVKPRVAVGSPAPGSLPPHYDLNVEVGSDGSVHIIPPLTNAETAGTNAPAR